MASPAFRRIEGKTKKVFFPIAASVACTLGELAKLSSGTLVDVADNDTQIEGVFAKTVASTDADYASAKLIPLEVPVERHVVWQHINGASFVATDIGNEFGVSDEDTVDHSDTTNDVFKVVRVLSATVIEGYLKINGSY